MCGVRRGRHDKLSGLGDSIEVILYSGIILIEKDLSQASCHVPQANKQSAIRTCP